MKSISKKILFFSFMLFLAQPFIIHTAVNAIVSKITKMVSERTSQAAFAELKSQFLTKAKSLFLKTSILAGAGYTLGDIFVSDDPTIIGATARKVITKQEEVLFSDSYNPSTISLWDILKNSQSMTGQPLDLSESKKESLLNQALERIKQDPTGNARTVSIQITHASPITSTPAATSLPVRPTTIQSLPTSLPTPAQVNAGWLSYIPGATVIYNNPKISTFAYVVGGTLALYTYKKLKLASYKAKFYKHLTEFTVLGNQDGLDECSRIMKAFDPVQYTAATVINIRMAADFINRLEHQGMSSGFLKFIFPVHVALFSALRYLGNIA